MWSIQIAWFIRPWVQPKYIQFTTIYDEEKHQIVTLEKLEPKNCGHFCLKNE